MRAEQLTNEELGQVRGNYWRLIGDDETVLLDRVALPVSAVTPEQALTLLVTARNDLASRETPEFIAAENAARLAKETARNARRSNSSAIALRTLLLTANDSQINSHVDMNLNGASPQVRTMFKDILKLIAADMRED